MIISTNDKKLKLFLFVLGYDRSAKSTQFEPKRNELSAFSFVRYSLNTVKYVRAVMVYLANNIM